MLKDGHKHFSGLEGAVYRNIEAASALSEMVQTSLGPNGMNKLVVNHLEKHNVTSDCAAILNELEVQHPAAKMLAMAVQMQEKEFGDQTALTMSFAGQLLKLSEELLRHGLHASEIVAGYRRAYAKLRELLPTTVSHSLEDPRDEQALASAISSVLATKQFGYEGTLSRLVAQACVSTMPPAPRRAAISVDNVRVAKLKGGSLEESTVIRGVVALRDVEGTVTRVENARVAVYGCGLEASGTEAKGTVLIRNADELMNYNKSEESKMEEVVGAIAAAGVRVVVCNGSVADMALHFLNRNDIMVVKITSKFELRRLCGAVGATGMMRLGAPTPDEMGECTLVEVREVSGRKVVVFEQDAAEDSSVATIVLRASTDNLLNDVERAVDDGVNAVKALCNDPAFVVGAGACELRLARELRAFAATISGMDQYAVRKFADSLDVVVRTLAENAGRDGTEALATLQAANEANPDVGINVVTGEPFNAKDEGIVDALASKANALRLATDAACTVLSVDSIIMAKVAGGPKPPKQGGHDA